MKDNWNKFKASLWSAFQAFIVNFLRTNAVELLVKNLLKASGFQAWLAEILIKYGMEEVVIPVVKAGFVRVEFEADRREGAVFVRRLKAAEASNGSEDLDDVVDDINS